MSSYSEQLRIIKTVGVKTYGNPEARSIILLGKVRVASGSVQLHLGLKVCGVHRFVCACVFMILL